MRRLINSTYMSLDGVIGRVQDWPSVGDDAGAGDRIQADLLTACDAVLLGRATFESFATVWERASGDLFADRMNEVQKYLVSSTLTAPTWKNTTVIGSDVLDQVAALKAGPGGDIVQYGFGPLAHQFLEHGLLDELRLWVHPFFFGAAGPDELLFRPGPTTNLSLTDTATLDSGICILTYAVPRR